MRGAAQGTMMRFPLTLTHVLERARRLYGDSEIVSRLPDKSLHRYRYRDFYRRAHALGLQKGDRVATLMWDHYAHLEAYLAIPCAGGALHTLNLRLNPDDIAFIANHAPSFAKFWLPDDVVFVAAIPKTSTGKMLKATLREQFQNHFTQ